MGQNVVYNENNFYSFLFIAAKWLLGGLNCICGSVLDNASFYYFKISGGFGQVFLYCFKIRFLGVALAVLELHTRLASNSETHLSLLLS